MVVALAAAESEGRQSSSSTEVTFTSMDITISMVGDMDSIIGPLVVACRPSTQSHPPIPAATQKRQLSSSLVAPVVSGVILIDLSIQVILFSGGREQYNSLRVTMKRFPASQTNYSSQSCVAVAVIAAPGVLKFTGIIHFLEAGGFGKMLW